MRNWTAWSHLRPRRLRPSTAPCGTASSPAASGSGRFLPSGRAHHRRSRWAVSAACSLELVHTYSLIRRPSRARQRRLPARQTDVPQVFGEDMAILAGDALLTRVSGTSSPKHRANRRVQPLRNSPAAGTGWYDRRPGGDLEAEAAARRAASETIHRAKTGALLRTSLRISAIYQRERRVRRALLPRRAHRAASDVDTATTNPIRLGKTAGRTRRRRKSPSPRCTAWPNRAPCRRRMRVGAPGLEPFGTRATRLYDSPT